jgi:hypothetical protein
MHAQGEKNENYKAHWHLRARERERERGRQLPHAVFAFLYSSDVGMVGKSPVLKLEAWL